MLENPHRSIQVQEALAALKTDKRTLVEWIEDLQNSQQNAFSPRRPIINNLKHADIYRQISLLFEDLDPESQPEDPNLNASQLLNSLEFILTDAINGTLGADTIESLERIDSNDQGAQYTLSNLVELAEYFHSNESRSFYYHLLHQLYLEYFHQEKTQAAFQAIEWLDHIFQQNPGHTLVGLNKAGEKTLYIFAKPMIDVLHVLDERNRKKARTFFSSKLEEVSHLVELWREKRITDEEFSRFPALWKTNVVWRYDEVLQALREAVQYGSKRALYLALDLENVEQMTRVHRILQQRAEKIDSSKKRYRKNYSEDHQGKPKNETKDSKQSEFEEEGRSKTSILIQKINPDLDSSAIRFLVSVVGDKNGSRFKPNPQGWDSDQLKYIGQGEEELFASLPEVSKDTSDLDEQKNGNKRASQKQELLKIDNAVSDGFGAYLRDIGKSILLSEEEEIFLSKKVWVYKYALLVHTARIAEKKLEENTFSEKELEVVSQLIAVSNQCQQFSTFSEAFIDNLSGLEQINRLAKQRLAKSNTRLVVSFAKHYLSRGLSLEELVQEGNEGLMRAVDKYDYTTGNRFSTYGISWIRQAITRALASKTRNIRVPVYIHEKITSLRRAQRSLFQTLRREPTIKELAVELDVPEKKVKALIRQSQEDISLNGFVAGGDDSEVGDFIPDETEQAPEDQVHQESLRTMLNKLLPKLPIREERILRLRFGLEDGIAHTLEEVALKIGVTRERVRQIEKQALNRLRELADKANIHSNDI